MATTDLILLLVLCAVGVSSSKMVTDVGDGSGRLLCGTEGRFAHPDNCGEYVDCIPGGDGRSLHAHPGSCRGGEFNPDVKKCLVPGKDSNCTGSDRRARAITTRDPELDILCIKMQSGFFCSSCKTLVNCVNGRAHVENCGLGHTCDEKLIFGGGVCYPDSPPECLCEDRTELRPDPHSLRAYLECDAGNSDPNVQLCKKDMVFNKEILMCEFPQGYVECTKRGIFPNPEDCTEYHKCMPVTQGLIQYTFSCTCGLVFNDVEGKCEDPCSFLAEDFLCEAEGRYRDEYDCHKFYVCIADGSAEFGYRQYHASCPQQSFWRPDQDIQGTGSCQVSRGINDCTSRQTPRCGVPVARNCSLTPDVTTGGNCLQGSANCDCDSASGQLSCQDGYTSDGLTCTISGDETCGGETCDTNATCTEDVCQCLDGFNGNGLVCTPEVPGL